MVSFCIMSNGDEVSMTRVDTVYTCLLTNLGQRD